MSDAPVRVAVVGSGPAGFYAAGHLLSGTDRELHVDMLDRLPTPWGLVRSGVAPDHPKIKTVTRVFEKTAAHSRFRFLGNVEFGTHVSREELRARYHVVVYATGSSADRPLGIAGEHLAGSWAATDFVGWYNGHPDHCDLDFDLGGERAVVIGNGNVALDVARMLTLTRAELAVTDVADHALEVLAASRIREIVVLGRRGPQQAAFTNPELRELGALADADVVVDPQELDRALPMPDLALDARATRNLATLRGFAQRPLIGHGKRIVLRFLLSPVQLLGHDSVQGVSVAHNELVVDSHGALRAQATERRETIAAQLVLRAVGYRGVALPGVPFDEQRAVIANENGRVSGPDGPLAGEYVVGWIKRGPSGVIGTNKKDAQETVNLILEDLQGGRLPEPALGAAEPDLMTLLLERDHQLVTYSGWETIDGHERGLGEAHGRPRVKLTRIGEMVQVAAGSR